MKKTAFILLIIILLNTFEIGFCAEISTQIEFDCGKEIEEGFECPDGNVGEVSKEIVDGRSCLRLFSDKTGTTNCRIKTERINTEAVFEVELKAGTLGGEAQILTVTSDGKKLPLIRFSSNGSIYLGNGSTLMKLESDITGEWEKYAFIFNVYNGKYSVLRNGKYIAENIDLSIKGTNNNTRLYADEGIAGFDFSLLNASEKETEFFIDNILIYKGDVLLDKLLEREEAEKNKISIKEKLKGVVAFKEGSFYGYFDGMRRKLIRSQSQMLSVASADVTKSLHSLKYEEYTPYVENGKVYVPVEFVLYGLGYVPIQYDSKQICVNIEGEEFVLAGDGTEYSIDYKGKNTRFIGKGIENTIFAPADVLAEILGREIYKHPFGFYMIGEDLSFFRGEMEEYVQNDLRELLNFHRPSGKEIADAVKKNNPDNQHPRLMIPYNKLGTTLEWRASYPEYDQKMNEIVNYCKNTIIKKSLLPYRKSDGKRILDISREMLSRLQYLAFAYNISKDKEIAEYGIRLMEHICSYPDWNQIEHYLDTGEMCAGIAYGYDAFYYEMTPSQRANIRQTTYRYALSQAEYLHKYNMNGSWVMSESGNWNPVCNSGVALACLVMCDDGEYESTMEYLLERIYIAIELFVGIYAPEGAYPEGYGYWNYALEYVVRFIQGLSAATGDDFGYYDVAGLVDTCYYALYMQGGAAVFNYHDTAEMAMITTALFTWFGNALRDKNVQSIRKLFEERYGAAMGLAEYIDYDPSEIVPVRDIDIPLDKFYTKSIDDIVILQSGWDNASKTYLGMYVGNPQTGHSHLESGTFVLDAMGERWACDLGPDNYSAQYYLTTELSYDYFYRKRPEGNNCVVISPDNTPGQKKECDIGIISYDSKPKGGFAVADLTDAYRDWAKSYKRGVMLERDTGICTIQDEIETASGSADVWWFMHNRKQIQIRLSADKKRALLTKNNKRMLFEIASPQEAVFEVMECESLPSSPRMSIEGEYPRDEFQKLAIHLTDVGKTQICVKAQPLYIDDEPLNSMADVKALDKWSIDDDEVVPRLRDLRLNGETIADFSADNMIYNMSFPYDYDGELKIEAESDNAYVKIAQGKLGETAVVTVEDRESAKKRQYAVMFEKLPIIGAVPKDAKNISITRYNVSSSPQENNSPENIFDDNFESYWASNGNNEWLIVDLEKETLLRYMGASWKFGDTRKEKFNLYISDDAKEWTKVFEGQSSGQTSGYEYTELGDVKARYFKMEMYGTNAGNWNSLQEFRLFTAKEE